MGKEYRRRGRAARRISQWAGRHRYFPMYIRAVCHEWMDFLFGVTPLAVVFLIYWALANPGNWPLVLIFLVALILAGFYAWYSEYSKIIPKLSVSNFFVQRTPLFSGSGLATGEGVFIQLAPKCLTDGPVNRCKANLIRIFKKDSSGQWVETGVNEPSLLKWSSWNDREVDLEPGAERRLNVGLLASGNPNRLSPESDFFPSRAVDDLRIPAEFSFDIKFSAEECSPVYVSLEMNVKAWQDVSCTLWGGLTHDPARKRLS